MQFDSPLIYLYTNSTLLQHTLGSRKQCPNDLLFKSRLLEYYEVKNKIVSAVVLAN